MGGWSGERRLKSFIDAFNKTGIQSQIGKFTIMIFYFDSGANKINVLKFSNICEKLSFDSGSIFYTQSTKSDKYKKEKIFSRYKDFNKFRFFLF